ncbi:MAG TPA: GNAT family N-acetyltransferase [Herpetosiphonaceae bacterium]
MPIRSFSDARQFLELAQPFLERDEVTSAVIFGVSRRLAERPYPHPYYLALVEDEHGPLLAAMMTPPHRISVWSDRAVGDEALDLLVGDLLAGGWPVPGAQGEVGLAERFAGRWAALTGQSWRLKLRERTFKLTEVTPPQPPVPGRLRPATLEDLDLLAGWVLAFEREALGEGMAVEAREVAESRINAGALHVWEDEGEIVSMAAWGRPTTTGITINLVYTPPDRRRRGYAAAAVAELSQRQLDAGKAFCTLFTDLGNPTSNHIYQEIGYRPVADFNVYLFDAPAAGEEDA